MKNLISLFLILFAPVSSIAQDNFGYNSGSNFGLVFGRIGLHPGVGIRTGTGDKANKIGAVVLQTKLSHTDFKLSGKNHLSLATPGVAIQSSDWGFVFFISPVMVVFPGYLSFSMDIFIPKANDPNGLYGFSFSYPL